MEAECFPRPATAAAALPPTLQLAQLRGSGMAPERGERSVQLSLTTRRHGVTGYRPSAAGKDVSPRSSRQWPFACLEVLESLRTARCRFFSLTWCLSLDKGGRLRLSSRGGHQRIRKPEVRARVSETCITGRNHLDSKHPRENTHTYTHTQNPKTKTKPNPNQPTIKKPQT